MPGAPKGGQIPCGIHTTKPQQVDSLQDNEYFPSNTVVQNATHTLPTSCGTALSPFPPLRPGLSLFRYARYSFYKTLSATLLPLSIHHTHNSCFIQKHKALMNVRFLAAEMVKDGTHEIVRKSF